jgi:hypothetical protein
VLVRSAANAATRATSTRLIAFMFSLACRDEPCGPPFPVSARLYG